MPVTLAQAKLNATDDVDVNVINEFEKKSTQLLARMTFDDVVNPAGGGSTLTYGYTRQITQRAAGFRAINAEYTPTEATKQRYTVDLKPLGGSFQIDRVLDAVAAGAETAFQMNELINQSAAAFANAVFNGDTAVDANGFDGLSKILTGSDTEYMPVDNGVTAGYLDWTTATLDTKGEALAAMAHVDAWLATLDGPPDVIYGNRRALALFRGIAAWSEMIDRSTDQFGRQVLSYGGIPLVDPGATTGANTDILALATRDADEGGAGGNITNLADLYAVRFGLDGFHGVSVSGQPLVNSWLPDFSSAGAVKTGEVEMGPVAVVLKRTKAAGVLRNIKVA